MRKLHEVGGLAILGLLGVFSVAGAQDGNPLGGKNPLDGGGDNPLAQEPEWVGVFVSLQAKVGLILHTSGPGFEGLLATEVDRPGETSFAVEARLVGERLEGTFGRPGQGQRFQFTATLETPDELVLVSANTTYRLERNPDAPRSSSALRETVASKLGRGGGGGGNRGSPEGNEAAAIGALKTITTCETLFREGDKEGDGELDYGTLRELADVDLCDAALGSGTRQGYVFEVRPSPTTPEFLWMATARPSEPGVSGRRFFAVNHAGVIYYSTRRAIDFNDECRMPSFAAPLGQTEPADTGGGITDARPGARPEAQPAARPDVSHLAVGQRYTYESVTAMSGNTTRMTMVYEVRAITPQAIRYAMTFVMEGVPPQPPTDAEWPLATTATTPAAAGDATVTFESITLAGRAWRCMRVSASGSTSWVFAPNDVATFPLVKTETNANGMRATMQLVRVEEPRARR